MSHRFVNRPVLFAISALLVLLALGGPASSYHVPNPSPALDWVQPTEGLILCESMGTADPVNPMPFASAGLGGLCYASSLYGECPGGNPFPGAQAGCSIYADDSPPTSDWKALSLTSTCSPAPGFWAWVGSTGHSAYVPPGGSFLYQEALAFWFTNGHVSFVVDANSGLDCVGSYTVADAAVSPTCDEEANPGNTYSSDSSMVAWSPFPTLFGSPDMNFTVCKDPVSTTIPFQAHFIAGLSDGVAGMCDPSLCLAGGAIVCDPLPVSSGINFRTNVGGACIPIVVNGDDNVTVYVNGTLGGSFSFAACVDDNWDGNCRPDTGDFIRFRECGDPHPLEFQYPTSRPGGYLIVFAMHGVSCNLEPDGFIEGTVEKSNTDPSFAPRYNSTLSGDPPPPAYTH